METESITPSMSASNTGSDPGPSSLSHLASDDESDGDTDGDQKISVDELRVLLMEDVTSTQQLDQPGGAVRWLVSRSLGPSTPCFD